MALRGFGGWRDIMIGSDGWDYMERSLERRSGLTGTVSLKSLVAALR